MFKKIKNFFKKLNPMNAIEKWVLKHVAKKIVKKFPDLKQKGFDFIEKNQEKLFAKIEIAIAQFVEKYESKSDLYD